MNITNATCFDMKKHSFLFFGLCTFFTSTTLLTSCNKDADVTAQANGLSDDAAAASARTSVARDVGADTRRNPLSAVHATGVEIDAYLCSPADLGCNVTADPFTARSKEEATWLAAHGYPSKAKYQAMMAKSLEQLQAEAAKGDRSAAVVYAQKIALVPNGFYDGVGMLHDQAVSGNLFAYYGLSDVYWNSAEHKDLVGSAAYLRVAYLLGDWKVTNKIGQLDLSPVEFAAADERAAKLRETFSGDIDPSPRPIE